LIFCYFLGHFLFTICYHHSVAVTDRFKAYKKYIYQYTTESRNAVAGTDNFRNGPKVTCQVEIEVPQTCSFLLHTRDCALSEVSVMDPQGQPVYRRTSSSEDFQKTMEKNLLKFTVDQITNVKLYPEPDEPVNILNIKRGIVSALMMPIMEDEQSSLMSTVHGECFTDYRVNARKDIVTDVSLSRDLSQCDQFYSRELTNSPLALLQRLHHPISKLIRSTQNCNYQFDNRRKHMTTAECTETHTYLPFSHDGISSVVTQSLTLQDSARINNRLFDASRSKPLHFEEPEDKAPVQMADATLSTLRDLMALAGTDQGQRRASLFHKMVSSMRALTNETLSQTVKEMLEMSGMLTWQALFQCGTPECTSAILQGIRTIDGVSLEVDALVYGLSLQANPDPHRVRDMLSMAQFKQSKAIMYALSNTVVGVMGRAMQDASPSLISSLFRCAKRTDIPLSNQKAAIQAFRLMDITDEVRDILMEVYRDVQSPLEKRIAAYLILMKNPDRALVTEIVNSLEDLGEQQLNLFVISHLDNIRHSTELQMQRFREYVELAMKDNLFPANSGYIGKSRNYKMETPLASVEGHIIFDPIDTLPKEVMLETTLKVFDYNYDVFEIGIEGNGFEPTFDALFGEKGFFPDSISRALYWANDKVPEAFQQVLDRIAPNDSRMKRQVPQDLLKDIIDSVNRLIDNMHSSPAPEATAYLRLLGNEMGYIKTSEIRQMTSTLMIGGTLFFKHFQTCCRNILNALTSSTENEIFAHYIFMENAFSLPTASGLPLKFLLAGVFAPGAKGGLILSPSTQLSFMPSVGLEFITQMGVHVPEFVVAGIEMHTNMYHESSLNAKVTINRSQIKLSIPAPMSNIQLFSFSNKLLSVSSSQMKIVPSMVEDQTDSNDCQPLFTGLKYCTIVHYSNGSSTDQAPYYPLTGETRFAVEIQPTGEVSDYTATITSETLRAGKEGQHKVDSLKLTLKAEGVDSTEATAFLKYNHNKNIFTTEFVIPDYDMEVGINLAVTDTNTKGKKMRGITFDVTNRNIPQLSLVGRTRLEMMKDAMLQVQMIVPSLKVDTSITATLKKDEGVIMDVETAINIPETSSLQKVTLKYDDDKFEVEVNSDLNSEIQKLNIENYHRQLQQLIDDILDQKVAKTDMKLRHIVTKGIEAGNIWLDKLAAGIPYVENLRYKRSISDLTLPVLPEKLFLQSDSLFRYQFNKDKMAISLPLPLGGKTLEDLKFPTFVSFPLIHLPKIGLHVPAKNFPVPSFTIPWSVDFMVPLLGLAEASTKINSNFYNWEGSISGGNNTVDVPSYIAQYKVIAQSPFNSLSYKLEGTGMISGRAEDNIKYLVNGSFSHSLIDTSFSVIETVRETDKLDMKATYKIEVSSPLGLHTSLYYSAQSTSTPDKVTGDGTMDGSIKVGSQYTNTTYTVSYTLCPQERKGRGESNLHITSPFIQAHNMIQGVYANSELNILSKTNMQNDVLKHVAELKYKNAQLTLKCSAVAKALGKSLSNNVELGISSHMAILRIESQADDATNRAYSLITGSMNPNNLEVNSEGSLTFDAGRGLHKASVTVGSNGLIISGTNSIQCSPVTFENIFNGAIDSRELNIEGKITAQMKTENSHTLTLTLWTLAHHSKSNNFICEDVYYKQDTKVVMEPFVTSIDVINDFKLYDVNLNNEGHMKLKPFKMDLTGSWKGVYREEQEIKHSYEINYADMAGTVKSSTSGNIMDAQFNHNCEFEFAGLSSKSNCEAQINSEPLQFDSTIRTMAMPFSFSFDALVNSDGEMNLNGKHNGQLYSKLLVKAEPLAFAYSYDSQVSTSHMLESGESSTYLDNKFGGLLTPSEQTLRWKTKSKFNEHIFNQDISIYNNPERTGLEFSEVILTNIFRKLSTNREKRSEPENQEFSMSGFLKYDKNNDCHIFEIPFIESLPVAFEQMKNVLVNTLQSLQQFINSLEINELISEFRAKLHQLPQQVSDFMREMDLENKVNQVKEKLDYFTNEFTVTMDDLELAMENLKKNFEKTVMDTATKIRDFILTVKDFIKQGDFSDAITNLLSKIGNELKAFDEKYEIRDSLVKVIDAIDDVITQIDLQKLTERSAAWLQELDSKYGFLEKIKEKATKLKQAIETFDVKIFFQNLRDDIVSVDVAMYVEQLSYKIPSTEIARVIESMNDIIVNWIDEYEITTKLNAVHFYCRDILVKYDLDKKFKELLDQAMVLIKEFKIEETVQSLADALRAIKFEYAYNKMLQFLDSVISQLKAINFKKSIDELNESISSTVKSIKGFDYSAFVDEANMKIVDLTNYVNEQIKTYEIVQKVEAVREFFREIQTSITKYLDELKNTKVAELVMKLNDVVDTTIYNDIKMKVQEILEDMRQRILDMDIRDEIYIYLQRASESYTNMIAYISVQFNRVIEEICKVVKDNEIINQIKQAISGVLDALKTAEVEVPSFTMPLTDLVIPKFTINLNKLHEVSIPDQISVPEFSILSSYAIPAFTIDFKKIKANIVAIIDCIREYEINMPKAEEIFGDLKIIYLSELPDLTFPDITLSEVKLPAINIPKLNLEDFDITMLSIPESKMPEVPSEVCIPVFGKLHGEFRVTSPHYTLVTIAAIENSTATPKSPQFTAILTCQAKSSMEFLDYSLDASAQLAAPRMKKLLFTETVKATHLAFSVDHEGSLALTGPSAEASAKTVANATTQIYTANLVNNMAFKLKSGISAATDTSYSHNINIPTAETSSQGTIRQNITTKMESDRIIVTGETTGNGKWSIQEYSDEGTHKSNLEFTINFSTAKLIFGGETDCKALKMKQTMTAESVILSHIIVEARTESEMPSIKKSVMVVNAEAHTGDLKIAMIASHDAELSGRLSGSISNSVKFLVHPFEIVLNIKNIVNSKVIFPLKLTGKVDLEHDYSIILNSEKQHANWVTLARFNQYKYNHNFALENSKRDMFLHLSASGEANLDFLTVPLTVPEMTIPYMEMKTPEVKHLSLWEHAGFKTLLTTPQQSFDMNLKLDYHKNPDIQNSITIPAMGNITYDFSFKSTVMALSTNAGLYNQSDIVARFGVSSASVFDILNGKINGSTSLTRKRGIKLATTVSLEHRNMEASHDCTLSLSRRSMDASAANIAKINLPFLNLELRQDLHGNSKSEPNIDSKINLKYVFNIPQIESQGKGNIDLNLALETPPSYVSLESTAKGKTDITILNSCNFAGDLENEATLYLNANNLRSTFKTDFKTNIDLRQEKQKRSPSNMLQFDMNENFALEVSLHRVYAVVDYTNNNNVNFASFNTNGNHVVKGTLDLAPLRTLKVTVNIDASQPCSLGYAGLLQNMNLDITSEKQSFTWSRKEQLGSLIHAYDLFLSSDVAEVRMDLTGWVEGHLAFLKSVKLPSICTSTMIFLEYDLGGKASLNPYSVLFKISVHISHVLKSTVSVDGITTSVSSPSSGFLGLHVQRRSPSQLYGKFFSRYLSTPGKDTDILTIKASLRNSERLSLQTNWDLVVLYDMIEGSKERMPAITEALLKFINKYHTAHFGFDLNRAGMKLKNSVSNAIERVYHEVPMSFSTLQNSVEQLSDQGNNVYRKVSDSIMSINVEQNIKILLDALMKFLSDTKFAMPGFEEKMTGLEISQRACRAVSSAMDRATQGFANLMEIIGDTIFNYTGEIQFTIPGTSILVNAKEIMENLMSSLNSIKEHPVQTLQLEVLLRKVGDLLLMIFKKLEELTDTLRAENLDFVSQIEDIYTEALQSSKQHIEEARRNIPDILQSYLYGGIKESIDLIGKASQNTTPYIQVSNKKMDINIPLPFFWKSFSEWPTLSRQ
uniref:Apolipoprotein B n=1 Tax=Myripristis murdjan TaxID=586833 RepID=A0A667Z134_9TELE